MNDALSDLDALLGSAGQEILSRLPLPPARLGPGEVLRLGEELRREFPPSLVAAAFTLHDLRCRAVTKFARAPEMLFTRAGLEQASGEQIARHRAVRFASHSRIADLCTGIGGDLIALAGQAPVLAVDRDSVHLWMAAHNAAVYAVPHPVSTREADVRNVDLTGINAVFIDPARRDTAGRMAAHHSEPPLAWCIALADWVPTIGIKATPGIDPAIVPPGWELEFIAEERELKEAVLWSPALASVPRRATILPGPHTLVALPGAPVPIHPPGAYLLDPNPAVTRAGLVEDLARSLGAWKIDEQIAFLSLGQAVATPFARTLRIVESMPWHLKRIGARLRELEIGAVDIRRRGLAGDVEDLRRRLKLRGPHRATLAMTRVDDRPWCLICTEPNQESPPG